MKSFSIHHLALIMVTMTGMMFAATPKSTKLQELLKQIKEKANTVLEHVPLNTTVIKIPKRHNICDNVFCCAEDILKLTPNDKWHDYYTELTRALHLYNKETHATGCRLSVNHTYEIQSFVDRVVTCVDYALLRPEKAKK